MTLHHTKIRQIDKKTTTKQHRQQTNNQHQKKTPKYSIYKHNNTPTWTSEGEIATYGLRSSLINLTLLLTQLQQIMTRNIYAGKHKKIFYTIFSMLK